MTSTRTSGPSKPSLAIGVILLGLAIFSVFTVSLDGPFVFDDASAIVNNRSIRQLWPLVGDADNPAPLTPSAGTPVYARPIVNLTFAINYYVGGLDPLGYRAVNVLIHFLAALVLWSTLARTLRLSHFADRYDSSADWLSLACALVWALHPLVTESVAYVTQRTESLMGLCYFATLYGAIRYWAAAKQQRTRWLVVATIACSAGMLCKEMIASAPAMVLLYERLFVAKSLRNVLARSWRLYAGLALSWVIAVAIKFSGQQTPMAGFDLGVEAPVWWMTQAKVFFMYLKLVVWPSPLLIHYDIPYLTTVAEAWPWLLAAAGYGVLALFWLQRRPAIGYAMLWVVAVLSPTLLIPLVGETVAERRMYVPLAVIVPLLLVGGYRLLTALLGSNLRRSFAMLIVTLAVACGWLSAKRMAAYQSELALWQDTALHRPNDPLARANTGISLTQEGRVAEALPHFERWVELEPTKHWAHYNLARALEGTNRSEEAIQEYRKATELQPDHAASHYNLARLLESTNEWLWAIKHYRSAIDAEPDFADAHTNLAFLLQSHGDLGVAIEHFATAARIQTNLNTQVNLTIALLNTQRRSETLAALKKSIALAEAEGRVDVVEELRRIVNKLQLEH